MMILQNQWGNYVLKTISKTDVLDHNGTGFVLIADQLGKIDQHSPMAMILIMFRVLNQTRNMLTLLGGMHRSFLKKIKIISKKLGKH